MNVNNIVTLSSSEEEDSLNLNEPPNKKKKSTANENKVQVIKSRDLDSVIKEKSKGDMFQKFLNTCQLVSQDSEMPRIVEKIQKTHHVAVKAYTLSLEFQQLLREKRRLIITEPRNIFVHIKEVMDELRLRKKKAPLNGTGNNQEPMNGSTMPVASSSKPSDPVTDDGEVGMAVPVEHRKIVKKLTKVMRILHYKIQKLETQEVDFDDDDDSSYLKLQRYRDRFCKVRKKLCEYVPELDRHKKYKITFSGTPFTELNRRIESFVNKKKEFPDYHDVLKLVIECNVSSSPDYRMKLAQEAFEIVGNELQRRRKWDDWSSVSSFLGNKEDPAELDPELNAKLHRNYEEAKTKISCVINQFADQEVQGNLEPEEVADEDAEQSAGEGSGQEEEEEIKAVEEEDHNDIEDDNLPSSPINTDAESSNLESPAPVSPSKENYDAELATTEDDCNELDPSKECLTESFGKKQVFLKNYLSHEIISDELEPIKDDLSHEDTSEVLEPIRDDLSHENTNDELEPTKDNLSRENTSDELEPMKDDFSRENTSDKIEPTKDNPSHENTSDKLEPTKDNPSHENTSNELEPTKDDLSRENTSDELEPVKDVFSHENTSNKLKPMKYDFSRENTSDKIEPTKDNPSHENTSDKLQPTKDNPSHENTSDKLEPTKDYLSCENTSDELEPIKDDFSCENTSDELEPMKDGFSHENTSDELESMKDNPPHEITSNELEHRKDELSDDTTSEESEHRKDDFSHENTSDESENKKDYISHKSITIELETSKIDVLSEDVKECDPPKEVVLSEDSCLDISSDDGEVFSEKSEDKSLKKNGLFQDNPKELSLIKEQVSFLNRKKEFNTSEKNVSKKDNFFQIGWKELSLSKENNPFENGKKRFDSSKRSRSKQLNYTKGIEELSEDSCDELEVINRHRTSTPVNVVISVDPRHLAPVSPPMWEEYFTPKSPSPPLDVKKTCSDVSSFVAGKITYSTARKSTTSVKTTSKLNTIKVKSFEPAVTILPTTSTARKSTNPYNASNKNNLSLKSSSLAIHDFDNIPRKLNPVFARKLISPSVKKVIKEESSDVFIVEEIKTGPPKRRRSESIKIPSPPKKRRFVKTNNNKYRKKLVPTKNISDDEVVVLD